MLIKCHGKKILLTVFSSTSKCHSKEEHKELSCVVKEWKILQQYSEASPGLWKSTKSSQMYILLANSISWSFTPQPNSSQSQMHFKITCEASEPSRCPNPTLELLIQVWNVGCYNIHHSFSKKFWYVILTNPHSLSNIKMTLLKVTNEILLFVISTALS